MTTYCLKCKRKTSNVGERVKVASNGASFLHSKCGSCSTNKCQAVKKSRHVGKRVTGKGFFGDVIKSGSSWLVNRGVNAIGL